VSDEQTTTTPDTETEAHKDRASVVRARVAARRQQQVEDEPYELLPRYHEGDLKLLCDVIGFEEARREQERKESVKRPSDRKRKSKDKDVSQEDLNDAADTLVQAVSDIHINVGVDGEEEWEPIDPSGAPTTLRDHAKIKEFLGFDTAGSARVAVFGVYGQGMNKRFGWHLVQDASKLSKWIQDLDAETLAELGG
jgi:hypothetical protein